MRIMRWAVVLAGVWALGVVLWTPAQQPPASLQQVVFVGRNVVFVAPRQMVAPPQVAIAEWSPSGRYLVAVTAQARWTSWESPLEVLSWSVTVWDQTRQQARQVGKGSAGTLLEQFHWLPGRESAVALVVYPAEQPQRSLVILNASQASLRTLATVPGDVRLRVSPTVPMGVLVGDEAIWLLRADGTLSAPMPLPADTALKVQYAEWSRDGRQLFWQAIPSGEWLVLDLATGSITTSPSPPERHDPSAEQPKQPLSVRVITQPIGSGEYRASTRALWLEGERSRTLVCADVEFAKLSPRGDAVFYISQGAGFVAPLVRAPREAYEQARLRAEREAIMSNAKRIALALMMYVQDHDETFPPGNMDIQSVLMPYVKNEAVFSFPGTTFIYLLDTTALKDISNPAETVAGYIQAPGGRAVIWSDGHVTWRTDQSGGR